MITGNAPRRIKTYLPIDYCAEGFGYVKPGEGEVFLGIPYNWHSDNSLPFIQHVKNGMVIKTINAADVAVIVFDIDTT